MYIVSINYISGSEPYFVGSDLEQARMIYNQLVANQGDMEIVTLSEIPVNTLLVDGMTQSSLVTNHKISKGAKLMKGWRFVSRCLPPDEI
jgi:hypothetical protein